jgi:tripartite-type tricarboxylate transporter receptor subunit TctC
MKFVARALSVALSTLCASLAAAQGFPSKPINTVVGFEPGGGTDTVARIIGKTLGDQLGQQVVVENKSGAGGTIAVDYVAKAAPDGYTLVLANVGAMTANPHIMKLQYDPLADLTPISMATVFANVLVVQPTLKVKNLKDYLDLARKNPEKITYASSGVGGAAHLAGELLAMQAHVKLVHVPYKGGGPAMKGFLGKEVDSFIATPVSAHKQVEAGKAVAIATTGPKRAKLMSSVPTVAESGFPGFEALNWYAYYGPKGLPQEIVQKLNREIVKALKDKSTIDLLEKQGVEAEPGTPEELAAYTKREFETWGKVIKAAGIKPQ